MMAPPSHHCGSCRFFHNTPQVLEAALPGLSSLSSGYAAVRLNDGLCSQHDRYVSAASRCARYAAA